MSSLSLVAASVLGRALHIEAEVSCSTLTPKGVTKRTLARLYLLRRLANDKCKRKGIRRNRYLFFPAHLVALRFSSSAQKWNLDFSLLMCATSV